MKRLFLKSVAAAAVLAVCGVAFAQERTIKFTTQNPKGHPLVMGMEKFAEIVQAKSGGKIKVNLFPGGVLGGDAQVVSAMQGGTVEMASLNSGILASQVKDFEVFDLPFLFANGKEADAVVDGPFGKKMHAKLEAKGLVGLTYWELGFRQITNSKRPITKVEDIVGLKLRVIPNAINLDWTKALGANPTPLAFPEVYAALEQGAIDGQENPLSVIAANKFFEVQKYATLTNHQYNPQSVLISKKFWDTLSAAEQKIISDAAAESTTYQRQQAREQANTALDAVKKGGMQVSELSAAELAKFREKMKPVIDKHGAASPDALAELNAELAKLRK
ncbi:TRAP transporter substrate-binding protein [Rhodoferax saidenbachensis]|uniref:ABC transporter substrate-binding protein n=1 Tax=Rhodoferax saidenbachensis TaxID=1484693 RepID=A0A1P8K7W7_9BURK|nr:TRAP transporter substrate-binding protein [Rhodoferax saidenbachensis]APW42071.1 ABC transporter substrate-binding protein [Rhodoferax saidenbachensis]